MISLNTLPYYNIQGCIEEGGSSSKGSNPRPRSEHHHSFPYMRYLFGGSVCSEVTCRTCNHKSVKIDPLGKI